MHSVWPALNDTRDREPSGYLLRENPRLQLPGDDTSDGAVFSVQHLSCSFHGKQFCASLSKPLGASLQTTGAGSFSKQSI